MIQLQNIVKTYDGTTKIIDNLDLTIEDGEFMVLVGESGCGKTTTMQ
ncbi:MAG: ATP-binding cassette domain-containing protein, partial [Sphaerochaetaceae bacterium]|nr:ATP-binding cassette domain-containing protein [Sphaerochaetaceae bacterium]